MPGSKNSLLYPDPMTQAANIFLGACNRTGGHRTVFAQTLMEGVDEAGKLNELKNYLVIDIRKESDYISGHIPGAINIQMADMAKPETLLMLPKEKPILLVCYTGQSASLVNGILGVLGYNAWTLRFGMLSWNESSPAGIWCPMEQQEFRGGKFPIVTGSSPN
jgi:rhodanese-related sulfurtransferase